MAKDIKIFMFMILAVFLMGFVSAFEWDNVKQYDKETKTITIRNSLLGIDWLSYGQVAEIQLLSDLVEIIDVGKDREIARVEVKCYEDYNNAFKELELFDKKKGMKEFTRDYDFKILSYKDEVVDDYDFVLVDLGNGTFVNEYRIIGSHVEQKEVFTKLSKVNCKKDDVLTIAIFMEVRPRDHFEWIQNFYGVKGNEWASVIASNVVFTDSDSSNTALTVYTFSGQNFGTADATRIIIIGTGGRGGTETVSSIVVAGESASFIIRNQDDQTNIELWQVALPTGTTGSVVVTWTGIEARSGIGVWALYDSNGTVFDSQGDSNNPTISLNIPVNGSVVGYSLNGATGGSTTWTGLTEKFDTSIGGSGDFHSGASDNFASEQTGYTISSIDDTSSGTADGMIAVSWYGTSMFQPIVTLNSPIDNFNSTSQTINYGGYVTSIAGIINVSLIIDGILNQTNSSGINDTDYNFTAILSDGNYNWTYTSCNVNGCETATTRNLTVDTSPIINVFSPLNQTYATSTIYFNATASETIDAWIVNYNGTNVTITINTTLEIEEGYFQLLLYGNNSVSGVFGLNDTIYFGVDTIAPIVNDAQNITDLVTFSLPINSTWNYTVTDPHLDLCYYNTSDNAALNFITCNSSINTTWATGGNKTIQYFANDTLGWETSKLAYVYVYYITYNQTDDPDPVGEGVNVTFDFNVSLTDIPITTATLRLNDTYYTPDITTSTADYYYFQKTITIPDGYGNATGFPQLWLWNFTIDGIITNSLTYNTNVTVYDLAIDDCSTYGNVILNLSLKDEEANTLVNGSAGSTIEIDLRLTSLNDPTIFVDYNNTWTDINESAVCMPLISDYTIDFTIGYQATDKVWEFFYLDGGILNSTKVFDDYTTSIIDLMDLITADSTSFLFNFFDTDGLPVDNSIVHVFRKYIGEGLFREVERGKADENGDTVIHLVEEDVIYYFIVTDNGNTIYTSSTYTALCQTTPCTIVLEAAGDSAEFPTDYDLVPDGNFSINSTLSTRTISLVYNMDTTTLLNFTIYKYESDGSYSSVATANETGTSGIITLPVPLSAGNVSFFATVYIENEFIVSKWVDFSNRATDYFGTTLSLFLAGLIILTLSLIAVSEGAGVIIFVIIGVLVSSALGLISTSLDTGLSVLIYLILAGGLIIWKLVGGRK